MTPRKQSAIFSFFLIGVLASSLFAQDKAATHAGMHSPAENTLALHEGWTLQTSAKAEAKGEVVDPVCGMIVDPAATRHHASHEGQDYHFCSAGVPGEIRESPQHPLLPRNLY